MDTIIKNLKNLNDWADYWRYIIGVNVVPADSRTKQASIPWKE